MTILVHRRFRARGRGRRARCPPGAAQRARPRRAPRRRRARARPSRVRGRPGVPRCDGGRYANRIAGGTFVLDCPGGTNLALAAYVEEPTSGRAVSVFTDQPGVQFYSGNLRGIVLRPYPGKDVVEVHDYHDTDTGVLASSLTKRAGYTSLGFPDPRRLQHRPPDRA